MVLAAGLISLLLPVQASAALDTADLDTVIVLDVSGSMKTTDEKRIALEGAKLFIDMMESANSRAGFLAFDSKVTTQYDLSALKSSAEKQDIKDAISSLDYKRGDTNIGEALKAAVEMLEQAEDTGNKKMVLLFTDGNVDLDNRSNIESEAEKLSVQTAKDATMRAAEEGIRIFTIGLNAGKSERFQMDPSLITKIAEKANGICRIVSSANELPGAFNDIFAHMIDSDITDLGEVTIASPDEYEEKEIHIPNESVLEANVILFTGDSGQLDDVRIMDPDQNVLEPDDEQLFFSNSSAYQLLKIIAPKAGDWLLQLKGKAGSVVHVDLIFNYDITLEASLDADESNDVVHVSARLLRKGLLLTDDAIYSQLAAKASVSNSNGTNAIYSMDLNEDHNYTCDVSVKDGESVKIRVHIEGANMYRNSEALEYSRIKPEADESAQDTALSPGGADASLGEERESGALSLETDEDALSGEEAAESTALQENQEETKDSDETKEDGVSSDGINDPDSSDEEAFDEDFQILKDDSAEDSDTGSLTERLKSSPVADRLLKPDVAIAAGLIALILLLVFLMRKR